MLAIILKNVINLATISNSLPYLYGITHLMTETTPYKRKCGKKMGRIGEGGEGVDVLMTHLLTRRRA